MFKACYLAVLRQSQISIRVQFIEHHLSAINIYQLHYVASIMLMENTKLLSYNPFVTFGIEMYYGLLRIRLLSMLPFGVTHLCDMNVLINVGNGKRGSIL